MALAASRYALKRMVIGMGDGGGVTYIPANPTIIFASAKMFYYGGQCCSDDGLLELIGRG
jgi:hypothetical protein